jgi:hypothetical protein
LDRLDPGRAVKRFIENEEWKELGLDSFIEAWDTLGVFGMNLPLDARRIVVEQFRKEGRV